MRLFSFLLASGFAFLSLGSIVSASNPTICTTEYAPVCAFVDWQKQTFSNSCIAQSKWINYANTASCNLIPVDRPVPPIIIGGDTDAHGCKPSTGYVWDNQLQECVRPWMTKTRLMNVLGDTVSCTGVTSMQCIQLQKGNKIELFDSSISGFSPVSWYVYRLLVREDKIENPPADASNINYSIVKVLSKKPISDTMDRKLVGNWTLDSYFIDDMGYPLSGYKLKITTDSYSIQFCNSLNGNILLKIV